MTSAEKIKELEVQLGLANHELKMAKDREGYSCTTINNDEKIRQELLEQIKLRRDLARSIMMILKLSKKVLGPPTQESFYIPCEAFHLIHSYLELIEEQYYVIPSTPQSTPKSKKDTK